MTRSHSILDIITINDLLDKEFDGNALTTSEQFALIRFHNFRAYYLNASKNDQEYQERYYEIQAKANLTPYEVFLNQEYNTNNQVRK